MALTTINPATGDTIAEFEEHSVDEVERRVTASVEAFREWSARPVPERAGVLSRMAGLLETERDRLAGLMTLEMGKTFRARSEEHTSELQSQSNLVCRLLLEKK